MFCSLEGEDEYNILFIGTGTLSIVVVISICSLFSIMDIYLKPTEMRKYKVQPSMNAPIDKTKFRKV